MDIDSTLKVLPLNEEEVVRIVNEIIRIHVEDGISFEVVKAAEIMADFEYPGVRLVLEARLDRLKQRIKIDLSTDDAITPSAIRYSYRLMFEGRSIYRNLHETKNYIWLGANRKKCERNISG